MEVTLADDSSSCGRQVSDPCSPVPAVRLADVSKSFPGVVALDRVTLEFGRSCVHGLVGENGAGKSTLIKMLTGADSPDAGAVEVFGKAVPAGDLRAASRLGISAIYQELNIVPEMTAAENVFLGRAKRRGPFVARAQTRQAFQRLVAKLGVSMDPNARARDLTIAEQQLLSIMRALEAEHGIVIMDEPTASLGPREREKLHEIVRGLRENGVTTIYVSHDLDEVLMLCDVVTVMRDGRVSATRAVDCWSKEELVAAMLGRVSESEPLKEVMLGFSAPSFHGGQRPPGREILRVDDLIIPGLLEDVSFMLREGEILGIAGLVGVGRTELLRALAGADLPGGGRLFIDGKEVRWPRSVGAAQRLGIALCPEERKTQGLVLSLTAAANVTLSDLSPVSIGPFIGRRRRNRAARSLTDKLGFDSRRLEDLARVLSGGNQQKLVIAKSLHRHPRVLLLDEPTRGVDVGARSQIFALIRGLADQGLALVVVSSELEEVIGLSDRVMILASGRQVCTLDREQASTERVLRVVFDVEGAA